MDIKEKRSLDKIVIIALLTIILILVLGIGYLLISDSQIPDFTTIFKSENEYTIPLDEFVVNLKSNGSGNNYLKIKLSLMFLDEDHGSTINTNMSKIRDLVIGNLRAKTSADLLSDEGVLDLKESIIRDINESLGLTAIQDIYITDIIVQ